MKISILNEKLNLKFVKRISKDVVGLYDPDKKEIKILETLSSKDKMDTTIHELLHVADYYKDEQWVRTVATDITDVLWKMGYRKIEE